MQVPQAEAAPPQDTPLSDASSPDQQPGDAAPASLQRLDTKLQPHFRISVRGVRVAYAYIRKNACSAWKQVFAHESRHAHRAQEYEDLLTFMGDFHKVRRLDVLEATPNRVLILRDPVDRAISGFLNQYVMRLERQFVLHELVTAATGEPAESMTFRQFVHTYLAGVEPSQLEGHFLPQALSAAPMRYTHVWDIKRLHGKAALLLTRAVADRYFKRPINATQNIDRVDDPAADAPVSALFQRWKADGVLPSADALLDDDLTATLRRVYAGDDALRTNYGLRRAAAD